MKIFRFITNNIPTSDIVYFSVILLIGFFPIFASKTAMAYEFAPLQIEYLESDPDDLFSSPIEDYFTSRSAPNLNFTVKCVNDGEKCWRLVKNSQDEVVISFSPDDTVNEIASARYRDLAYLLLEKYYDCGEDTCHKTVLINQNGIVKDSEHRWSQYRFIDLQITQEGQILTLSKSGLGLWSLNGQRIHQYLTGESLKNGRIQNDLNGNQSLIAIGENRSIWLSNGQNWQKSSITLPQRGDKEGILSSYPVSESKSSGVVYLYENSYRKGLHLIQADHENGETMSFPVFLSTERNVGWDPYLFITGENYVITSKDSTNNSRVRMKLSLEKVSKGEIPTPDSDKFPRGNSFSFFAGGGAMNRYWHAQSEVDGGNKATTDVDYNFEDALLKKGQFEGRIGNTRLVLSYMEQLTKNKAEKQGKVAEETVNYLTGMIDFPNMFSSSSGLRLRVRRSQTSGIADIKRKNQGDSTEKFKVEFDQISLYNIQSRGSYWGFEYTGYDLPSAVGFNDEKDRTLYSDYDPDLELEKLSIVLGYDPQSYAKRYENNYSNWFTSMKGGLGIGQPSISADVKKRALNNTSRKNVDLPFTYNIDSSMQFGYIWQKRSHMLGGLGFQFLLGYRGEGTYISTWDEESEGGNKLALNFERYDIWHGPFLNLNMVF